jgi:DNA topoisomerase-1
MSNLVIVESPAKCKKIGEILGPSFKVLATMGHIRALEEDLDAVGLDRDFEPRFRFLTEKSKATAPLVAAARNADQIYLAADDDREGEAIAYSVACLLKRDPLSLPRSVFHEITAGAVREAIANPRRIDMNRVHAQQARSVLDMMVGFTISPLLWKYVARALSAGRCQTPALRLVSDREKEVAGHSTETVWTLRGDFGTSGGWSFDARMDDELEDQDSAMNYMENIFENNEATVTGVEQRPWISNPPKPLITSTLQQEASALHKLNPKTTMKAAQSLYEAGHITYMRTDHAIMSEEAIKAAQEEVRAKYGDEYVGDAAAARSAPAASTPKKKSKKTTDISGAAAPAPQAQEAHDPSGKSPKAGRSPPAPQAQEAHEAIRPTHFENQEVPGDWSPIERKVYALIWRRAIQATMSPAQGQTRTVGLRLTADQDAFPWTAQWRTTTFQGWQIAGKTADLDADDPEVAAAEGDSTVAATWKKAQQLTVGTRIAWSTLQALPKRSRAPPRYTEATLIRELEKRGIGRPSTFASLVDVLFDKAYVEKKDISGQKVPNTTLTLSPNTWPPLTQTAAVPLGAEKQKLVPTALGESVLSFCLKEFPQLFAYEFTAQMEQRLDAVARGEEAWKQVCRDTWSSYKDSYARLKDKSSAPTASDKVRDFGGGLKAVMSKSGPLIVLEGATKEEKAQFAPCPAGVNFSDLTEEQARAAFKAAEDDRRYGEWNGKTIEKKKGPYGHYLECNGLRVPFVDSDTYAQVIAKFQGRAEKDSKTYKFGPYTFAEGQYGPYMVKTDAKQKIFVSIPSTIDPKKLTAEEADKLYKDGVEAKKSSSGGRGGFRGGRGGRGGFRGGRGGFRGGK